MTGARSDGAACQLRVRGTFCPQLAGQQPSDSHPVAAGSQADEPSEQSLGPLEDAILQSSSQFHRREFVQGTGPGPWAVTAAAVLQDLYCAALSTLSTAHPGS